MRRKGFTLIELLTVIAILAVILLISVPIVIDNIGKSKEKSYENQVKLFIEGAKSYALEYNSEIEWLSDERGTYTKVPLRTLIKYDYFDNEVMNAKTGEAFNIDTTIVTIYKNGEGYEFEYEDETRKEIRLINNIKSQTILQKVVYNRDKILGDVIGLDEEGKEITSEIKYICKKNNEIVECSILERENKELGTYTIEYRLEKGTNIKTSTRVIKVVGGATPIIEVRPEDNGEKVDSVRVTIIYPEGAREKKYSTKSEVNKEYTVGFEIRENQTITADCIDSNGLKCSTATREITHIKSKVELEDPDKGIVIAAEWPNETSMSLDLSGVRSDGAIEYKCKIGTKETSWSESRKCNITGLEGGSAYTVEVSARSKETPVDVISKQTTIYTAKMVAVESKTEAGTCPSNNTQVIAGTDIYDSATVSGTCVSKNYTCNGTKTLSSATSALPTTAEVECSGVKGTGTGGAITSTTSTYTCTVGSTTSSGTATCGSRSISCTTNGVTIKGTQANNGCTPISDSCNLTSTIPNSTACGGTKTSTCNGKTVTMGSSCIPTPSNKVEYNTEKVFSGYSYGIVQSNCTARGSCIASKNSTVSYCVGYNSGVHAACSSHASLAASSVNGCSGLTGSNLNNCKDDVAAAKTSVYNAVYNQCMSGCNKYISKTVNVCTKSVKSSYKSTDKASCNAAANNNSLLMSGFACNCTASNAEQGASCAAYCNNAANSYRASRYTSLYNSCIATKTPITYNDCVNYNYVLSSSAVYNDKTTSTIVTVYSYTTNYSYKSSWITGYKATYPSATLSKTSINAYYRTYTANNLIYKREHTITYNKVLVKPKKTIY